MSAQEFFHMGGYALYVWPAYALSLVVLTGQLWAAVRRRRKLIRDIEVQNRSPETHT